MSKNTSRKRAGTTTATAPPPPKKSSNRSAGDEDSRGDGNTKKSAGKNTKGKGNKGARGKQSGADPTLEDDGIEIVEDDTASGNAKRSGGPPKKNKATVEEVEDEGDGEKGPAKPPLTKAQHEAKLRDAMDRWDSTVYAFYKTPVVEFVGTPTRVAHTFSCAARGCKYSYRRFQDKGDATSTKSLIRHAKSCWGEDAVRIAREANDVNYAREHVVGGILKSGSITAHFERKGEQVTYSHRAHTRIETRTEIAKWVSESLRPFKIVKDRGFLVLMKTGRPGHWIPSPSTVSRDVKTVFARSRSRIARMLREYKGKLSFATDAWTSPNHRAFVAVTVHFEHDGKPVVLLLDVVEVAASHTGVELAAAFASILKEFGVEHKCLAVTCDNASNNDTMLEALQDPENLANFDGPRARVRCFLHILNLVAKSIIRQFDTKAAAKENVQEEEDEAELAELARELEGYDKDPAARDAPREEDGAAAADADDPDDEYDVTEEMTEAERKQFERDLRPVKLVLGKIRNISFKIIHSTTKLLPAWKTLCAKHGLDENLLPRDVKTRWNSTYDMISGALKYRKVVEEMCAQQRYGLRKFELSQREWSIAKQLGQVLKVFKDATLFFSRSTPNLAKVIPAIDHIDQVLTTAEVTPGKYDSAIRVACSIGNKTLRKFYSLTDASVNYRIAMVLHPGFKLSYFRKRRWPEAWIKVAREIVQTTYREHYAGHYSADEPDDLPSRSPSRATSSSRPVSDDEDDGDDEDEDDEDKDDDKEDEDNGEERWQVNDEEEGAEQDGDEEDDADNIFDALDLGQIAANNEAFDELARYLSTDPEPTSDPLMWWSDRRAMYPCLSRMALDFLSIPATSVDVERTFSKGRLLLTHVRNRLSAQTTRAVLCVGSWSLAGFVKSQDARKIEELSDLSDDEASDYEMEDGYERIDVNSLDQLRRPKSW